MNQQVWCKLDWFSIVLYNTSINSILEKLHIENDVFEEILSSGYERSQGFHSVMVWSFNGISIELSFDDYMLSDAEAFKFFQIKYAKIRLDISGSGLDYLRSFFLPDFEFVKPDFWGNPEKDYNITRCDFAFDFINLHGDFLDNILRYIQDQERAGLLTRLDSRLNVGRCGGIQYSYRCGANIKTLYLGSPRGDKMVRIYDKKLENFDKNGVWKKPDERFKDITIDSWFRIELQSRRKSATDFLFNCHDDIRNVLRVVFEQYLIRDKDGVPLPCMVDLYDWDSLPPISINSHFIQFVDTVDVAVTKFIKTNAWRSVYLYILRHGVPSLINLLNTQMEIAFSGKTDVAHKRYLAFLNKYSLMLDQEDISVGDLKGLDRTIFNESQILLLKNER